MIKELGKDSIILLSTHIVSDIENIADDVIMMKDGQIIFEGATSDISDLERLYLEKFEG